MTKTQQCSWPHIWFLAAAPCHLPLQGFVWRFMTYLGLRYCNQRSKRTPLARMFTLMWLVLTRAKRKWQRWRGSFRQPDVEASLGLKPDQTASGSWTQPQSSANGLASPLLI